MFFPFRKLIALLLAIWLPLFSGSALATSAAMQLMSGDCRSVAAQPGEHPSHLLSVHHHAPHHNNQIAASHDQAAGQHEQQNSSCNDCGACHFSCSGCMTTVTMEVIADLLLAKYYTPISTQFQSVISAPQNPPPLARA